MINVAARADPGIVKAGHHFLRGEIDGWFWQFPCRGPFYCWFAPCDRYISKGIACCGNSLWVSECSGSNSSWINDLVHLPHSVPQVDMREILFLITSSIALQILINKTPIRHINPDVHPIHSLRWKAKNNACFEIDRASRKLRWHSSLSFSRAGMGAPSSKRTRANLCEQLAWQWYEVTTPKREPQKETFGWWVRFARAPTTRTGRREVSLSFHNWSLSFFLSSKLTPLTCTLLALLAMSGSLTVRKVVNGCNSWGVN